MKMQQLSNMVKDIVKMRTTWIMLTTIVDIDVSSGNDLLHSVITVVQETKKKILLS